MPFGWGSTWDSIKTAPFGPKIREVTNAFRLGVHLGPNLSRANLTGAKGVTNAFRLGVHLGLATWAKYSSTRPLVTNAFRLGVHLGLLLRKLIFRY